MQIENVGIYVISHGRPRPEQRPTTALLDSSGLDYHIVMNEGQVADYVAGGVPLEKIVSVSQEFEDQYFHDHRNYKVDFHGAITNREMCNIHARKSGLKYAVQLDDNITQLSYRHFNISSKNKDEWGAKKLPEWFKDMRDIMESTNIGMLGCEMSTTPGVQKKVLRNGYAFSLFMENVKANIPWIGPFDDDVAHNLQFNHSGKYTNAQLTAFGYAKESTSGSGMRGAYDKYEKERPLGTASMYPDHVKIGVKAHANGKNMRYYHVFKGMHHNIIVTKPEEFKTVIGKVNALCDAYELACESGG